MGKIPVLPKDVNHLESEQSYITDRSLPLFYMSDYSVLGVLVDRFQEAARILEDNAFLVNRKRCGIEVVINHPVQVQKIYQIFKSHDIGCEVADLIDQVYQG